MIFFIKNKHYTPLSPGSKYKTKSKRDNPKYKTFDHRKYKPKR